MSIGWWRHDFLGVGMTEMSTYTTWYIVNI
jgi:hypothetical protein